MKAISVCDKPVRTAKFVPRKNWIVTGSDDNQIRVYDCNTLELLHSFEAHSDYIRSIVVHPSQPLILSAADDKLIKLWNWDQNWTCTQVFEGHTHYVMQVAFNPKDNNTFASASLDRTIKVWQLGSAQPNFTLDKLDHDQGITCVDFCHSADKPYLITGDDNKMAKIWDYQTKTCVQTLEGHTANVTSVCFHPDLPIILTGSEDGTVKIWNMDTYALEHTLNNELERVWTIGYLKGSNNVAIGHDQGSVTIKVGDLQE